MLLLVPARLDLGLWLEFLMAAVAVAVIAIVLDHLVVLLDSRLLLLQYFHSRWCFQIVLYLGLSGL